VNSCEDRFFLPNIASLRPFVVAQDMLGVRNIRSREFSAPGNVVRVEFYLLHCLGRVREFSDSVIDSQLPAKWVEDLADGFHVLAYLIENSFGLVRLTGRRGPRFRRFGCAG